MKKANWPLAWFSPGLSNKKLSIHKIIKLKIHGGTKTFTNTIILENQSKVTVMCQQQTQLYKRYTYGHKKRQEMQQRVA